MSTKIPQFLTSLEAGDEVLVTFLDNNDIHWCSVTSVGVHEQTFYSDKVGKYWWCKKFENNKYIPITLSECDYGKVWTAYDSIVKRVKSNLATQ